jgi:Mor family transcriptional regulator
MKRIDISFYNELTTRKNFNKKLLRKLCKKYKLSKSTIFGFLSFSEKFLRKENFDK